MVTILHQMREMHLFEIDGEGRHAIKYRVECVHAREDTVHHTYSRRGAWHIGANMRQKYADAHL